MPSGQWGSDFVPGDPLGKRSLPVPITDGKGLCDTCNAAIQANVRGSEVHVQICLCNGGVDGLQANTDVGFLETYTPPGRSL